MDFTVEMENWLPFLVTHGAGDRQVSAHYARQAHDQLTNSARREL